MIKLAAGAPVQVSNTGMIYKHRCDKAGRGKKYLQFLAMVFFLFNFQIGYILQTLQVNSVLHFWKYFSYFLIPNIEWDLCLPTPPKNSLTWHSCREEQWQWTVVTVFVSGVLLHVSVGSEVNRREGNIPEQTCPSTLWYGIKTGVIFTKIVKAILCFKSKNYS